MHQKEKDRGKNRLCKRALISKFSRFSLTNLRSFVFIHFWLYSQCSILHIGILFIIFAFKLKLAIVPKTKQFNSVSYDDVAMSNVINIILLQIEPTFSYFDLYLYSAYATQHTTFVIMLLYVVTASCFPRGISRIFFTFLVPLYKK